METRTIIKDTCPSCGDIELSPHHNVYVAIFREADRSYIHFTCPKCKKEFRGPVDHDHMIELVKAGVTMDWTFPMLDEIEDDELQDAARHHTSTPLTIDDVRNFVEGLSINWLAALVTDVYPTSDV